MSKLKEKLSKLLDFTIKEKKEYDYKDHLNWRDDGNDSHLTDGQGIEDPSKNDFLKGYNMNPYEFKQWAYKKGNEVYAAIETDPMKFTPEYLADKILTLWNGVDGPLQWFFEGFTLRYNNKLKRQLAGILEEKGYKVYPVLTDVYDKPIYAKHDKILKRIQASKNPKNILKYCKIILSKSEGINKMIKEIEDIEKEGKNINLPSLAAMTEYYKMIYPNDFAISMIEDLTDYRKRTELDRHKNQVERDYQISDEALYKIEDYMSGNSDPFYSKDYGSGQWSYDPVSDMRSDTTRPYSYEIRQSSKKKH